MTIISVPYHLDEYLPGLDLPLQLSDMAELRRRQRGVS